MIADLGLDSEVSERMCGSEVGVEVIDAGGKCIVPGLVDGHVHPVWAGNVTIYINSYLIFQKCNIFSVYIGSIFACREVVNYPR